MARGRHPTWHEERGGFSPSGGPRRRKPTPSRGLIIGTGAVFIFALFLAAVGAIVAQSSSGGAPTQDQAPAPGEITAVPPDVTPEWHYTGALPQPEAELTSSTGQAPRTVASSWSAGPTPVPPAPAAAPAPDAVRLAAEANEAYGVRIVMDGQDWGADDEAQVANVQAVISAVERLPDTILSAVVAHAHGPLTFVSNSQGRTMDGWQPYGDNPITYYTNSDQGLGGYHASNQVVLSVGSTSMSAGHEILHAYQFRNVGPDEYALALLQPEMRSFMEATGWRQTGSEEEVRQAAGETWSALDSLYVYEGRPLTYASNSGATSTIDAGNPIEAFAIAGSIYYARPSWMPLPDLPEYWAWFSANVG